MPTHSLPGMTLAVIVYSGEPRGSMAANLEPALDLLRKTLRSACEKLFVFCSGCIHDASKTDVRVPGLRWSARTCFCTHDCAPIVPQRATEEHPSRGCVRLRPLPEH